MDSDAVPLRIDYMSIADFLSCPICMCDMHDTNTTPCGHRFCEKCIKECLLRSTKCPCCNAVISVTSLIKDHQYDSLIAVIKTEKEKSEQQFFDILTGQIANINDDVQPCSRLESVLRRHLKKTTLDHENYLQVLQKLYDSRIHGVQNRYEEKQSSLISPSKAELKHLEEEKVKELEYLKNEHNELCSKVAEAFDRYLGEHIPRLATIPIDVHIILLNENLTLKNVIIQPTDAVSDVLNIIKRQMAHKGNQILAYGPDVTFYVFQPFCNLSVHEMLEMIESNEHGACSEQLSGMTALPGDRQLVLEGLLRPGCLVAVAGQISFESDKYKVCFAKAFKAGEEKQMDYFACQLCKVSWICRSCSEHCHKGHKISPYIMNHTPTWACCYCPKKAKCVL